MRLRTLPDLKFLKECFYIIDNILYWKKRPRNHFKSGGAWKSFNTRFAEKPAGSVTATGYRSVRLNGVLYQEHRVRFKLESGKEPFIIDHLDRNKSNNSHSNLRDCNHRRNIENSDRIRYTGGLYPSGKYRLRIRYKLKMHHVGMFNDRKEAESIYWEIQEILKEKDLTDEEVTLIISEYKPKRGK